MMTGWKLLVAAMAIAVAQIAFLGWVIVGRASILQNGTEILLKTQPVDPRDLFRGDYVRLGYSISVVPTNEITDINGADATVDGPIYALISKQPDGYWTLVSASFSKPDQPVSPDQAVIQGHVDEGWSLNADSSLTVLYGIERFYVPEGDGLEIESDMRERTFGVLAAVDDDGVAQVKALMDGTTKLYEEPLY